MLIIKNNFGFRDKIIFIKINRQMSHIWGDQYLVQYIIKNLMVNTVIWHIGYTTGEAPGFIFLGCLTTGGGLVGIPTISKRDEFSKFACKMVSSEAF